MNYIFKSRKVTVLWILLMSLFLSACFDKNPAANKAFTEVVSSYEKMEPMMEPHQRKDMLLKIQKDIGAIIKNYPETDVGVKLASRQPVGKISLDDVERKLKQVDMVLGQVTPKFVPGRSVISQYSKTINYKIASFFMMDLSYIKKDKEFQKIYKNEPDQKIDWGKMPFEIICTRRMNDFRSRKSFVKKCREKYYLDYPYFALEKPMTPIKTQLVETHYSEDQNKPVLLYPDKTISMSAKLKKYPRKKQGFSGKIVREYKVVNAYEDIERTKQFIVEETTIISPKNGTAEKTKITYGLNLKDGKRQWMHDNQGKHIKPIQDRQFDISKPRIFYYHQACMLNYTKTPLLKPDPKPNPYDLPRPIFLDSGWEKQSAKELPRKIRGHRLVCECYQNRHIKIMKKPETFSQSEFWMGAYRPINFDSYHDLKGQGKRNPKCERLRWG